MKSMTNDIPSRVCSRNLDEPSRLNFDLEDIIDALKNIRSDRIRANVIPDDIRLAAVDNPMSSRGSRFKMNSKGRKTRRNLRCLACSKIGHWARDEEFPLFGKAANGPEKKGRAMNMKQEHCHKGMKF